MLKKLVVFSLVILQFEVLAQTNSPYAYQGIGERFSTSNPAYSGLGNQSVSQANLSILNSNNAASYSFLRHQYPIFSLGVANRLSFYNQDGVKEFGNITGISEMAIGLSFYKLFGLSVGLKPYYKKAYDFSQYGDLNGDSIRYHYSGKGTINRAYFGFSVKVLNFDKVKWSVGANVGGLFGSMNDERTSAIVQTKSNEGGGDIRSRQMNGFQYDVATILQVALDKGHQLTFGATYEPIQRVKTTFSKRLFFSSSDVENENTWLTLTETGDMKGKIVLGQSYSAGVTYAKTFQITKKDGTIRNSQLTVTASYSGTNWSDYRENYADTSIAYSFKNTGGISAGVQFIPETVYIGNAMPKFFDRASYRVGFYTNSLPYVFNGSQLSEWAVTGGFGFPILIDRRLDSSIQFGFGAGKRWINQPGALNETFATFNIGFLIAPSFNDRWFVKRKVD